MRVPDVKEGLLREPSHRGAVALGRRQGELAAGLGGEPVVPAGHDQAGGQPLDIPLERARQGLVEVVDVEYQVPLGRRERAEIRQVGVTAHLHPKPGGGRVGQVRGHRQRRAPVVGERGHQHPPVPDRHQFRYPRRRLAQQQPDRVPSLGRLELGLRLQRGHRPGILPPRRPVRSAQMLRRRGDRGRCRGAAGDAPDEASPAAGGPRARLRGLPGAPARASRPPGSCLRTRLRRLPGGRLRTRLRRRPGAACARGFAACGSCLRTRLRRLPGNCLRTRLRRRRATGCHRHGLSFRAAEACNWQPVMHRGRLPGAEPQTSMNAR